METKQTRRRGPKRANSASTENIDQIDDDITKQPPSKKQASTRKRNRVPISCTICRRRKVKCGKERPVCTACQRTGVAHLCHYIDPPWAQPLSNSEIAYTDPSHDDGVEALKKKIRELEAQLQNYKSHSTKNSLYESRNNTSYSLDKENATVSPRSRGESFDSNNDTLDLGKKFDMLHIKSTSTVHLGATSWLAIMKGDPYLRVLWAHIFKLRKQVEEIKYKKQMASKKNGFSQFQTDTRISLDGPPSPKVCPISLDNRFVVNNNTIEINPYLQKDKKDRKSTSKSTEQSCPVSGKTGTQGKCPVAHAMEEEAESEPEAETEKEQEAGKTGNGTGDDTDTTKVKSEESNKVDNGIPPLETDTDLPEEDNLIQDDRQTEKVCPIMSIGDSLLSKITPPKSCPINQTDRLKSVSEESTTKDIAGIFGGKYKKSFEQSRDSESKSVSALEFNKDPVATIEKFLPTKKVLWLLIERFFNVLYFYLPFVDEENLKEDIRFIFGNETDEDQKISIQVRSGSDFALIGTVCILIRLAWNSLPINHSSRILKTQVVSTRYQEDQAKLDILQAEENAVSIKLVECVKHCFSNLKLMRKSSLRIVQCALYMRLYFMYSAEDGDSPDGGDSQIFLGTLTQMCISIGLYRDPENFENFSNERQRHLWRKIWFKIVSLDTNQSMNLGCPRLLQQYTIYSDTKLPGGVNYEDIPEDFNKDIKELSIINSIRTQAKVDELIAKTMTVLLNVQQPAKKFQVDSLIEQLTKCISGYDELDDKYVLPQLGKILINRSKTEPLYVSASRALEFQSHVIITMLIYLLNYILYVHFEPRASKDDTISNLARNYAQKALDSALEGYRNCTLFFDCGLDYFGPGSDIVLSPLMLLVGHRSMQFMVSLILRSRCGPKMRPTFNHEVKVEDSNVKHTKKEQDPLMHGCNSINNDNKDLNNIVIKDEAEEDDQDYSSRYNLDVDSGEILATILLSHMEKFFKLADGLGGKYHYSWRMGKAVKFFVTLLKKPKKAVKEMVKSDNIKSVETNKGYVSDLLNSVPLVLSIDEEKVKKCPVFMDTSKPSEEQAEQTLTEEPEKDLAGTTPIDFMMQPNTGGVEDNVNLNYNTAELNSLLGPYSNGSPAVNEALDVSGVSKDDLANPSAIGDNFVNLADVSKNFGALFGLEDFSTFDFPENNLGEQSFVTTKTPAADGDLGDAGIDFSTFMSDANWFS